ncbi:MAG TPA: DUF4136 domain-containing protein [Thermoanaerobaculia bacterium]|jgi:hypothetical protein
MTSARRLPLLALLSGALFCVGTHPAPRFAWDSKADFAAIKSFAWYSDPSFRMPHADSIVDGPFLDEHIRKAIAANLEKKGYRKAEAGKPDIFASYRTGQDGVASQDEWGVYDWWWFPLYVYEGSDYEKERLLTIDVRDSGRKLVWRGQISRLEGTNPDAVAREIDRTVADLLAKFPPAPGAVSPAKK